MKHDEPALTGLMMQARVLRRRCVEAHNRLQNDLGHSVLLKVIRCLPVDVSFDGHCVEHRLLSCYAFWGCGEVGGSRASLRRRLERSAPAPLQVLNRRLSTAAFGAWECRHGQESGASGDQEPAQWRLLGREEERRHMVGLVTNVDGERAYPVPGEVRVGWMVEEGEHKALLFSMSLAYEATVKLKATIEQGGWHVPEDGQLGGFRGEEYERDLITLAVRPDFEDCGLDPYYFLPLNQRRSFPGRFIRSLIDHIGGRYHPRGTPWHVEMARATTEASLDELRKRFDAARARAGRSAGRYRGDQVDPAHFPRIAPDRDILGAFGVGPDGEIDLRATLPMKMHLLEYLDLDDDWFEAAGISVKAPIHQARAQLAEANETGLRKTFDEAVERHRVRLRWVALMQYASSDEVPEGVDPLLASAAKRLEPEYEDLYEAAEQIFGATILDRPLRELLVKESRLTGRIEAALVEYGVGEMPLCVRDLPETTYLLGLVRGIGQKSIAALTRCLRDAMVGWADGLTRPTGDSNSEAAQGIERGLDELDALFG